VRRVSMLNLTHCGGRPRADFYFQTQHGSRANANPDDNIPTGWTIVGRPNYWDEYTHGRLGHGRCDRRHYTNDKFAVDSPLDQGTRSIWKGVDLSDGLRGLRPFLTLLSHSTRGP
jgi:hypothetical protein